MALGFSYLTILQKCFFINVLIITVLLFKWTHTFEQELTITVAPGEEECFFHTTEKGHVIEIDYQVRLKTGKRVCNFYNLLTTLSGFFIYSIHLNI